MSDEMKNDVNLSENVNIEQGVAPQPTPVATQYVRQPMSAEEKRSRVGIFGNMIIPTIIYAVIYAFCIYDNFSGILMCGFALATEIYMIFIMKRFEVTVKRGSYFYLVSMVLLGLSSGVTGDGVIIFFNTVFMFMLIVVFLLHCYYDDAEWGPVQYFVSLFFAVFESIPCIEDFFVDASCYAKENDSRKKRGIFGVLIGLVISVPLLAIIIGLLYSADIVFATMLKDVFRFDLATAVGVTFTAAFGFFSAYCGMRCMGKRRLSAEVKPIKRFDAVVAITVLSLIAVVYLMFSLIQIIYLFIGKMTLPAGYTYAQYAREGFFELLAVCMLNVVIVLAVMAIFKESKAIRFLLVVISACTYIMLASSALRMLMYIDAYHLSRLRIMVLWGLALIAVLLAGIVLSIFGPRFPLFRYGVAVVGVAYLILSYSHMDYFIARYNLSADRVRVDYDDAADTRQFDDNMMLQYDEDNNAYYVNYYDSAYLARLSSDAAPAFRDLPESEQPLVERYLANTDAEYHLADESLRQFNLSHEYVRRVFSGKLEEVRAK